MKLLKKKNLIFSLTLVGYLLFSIAPAARGFISLEPLLGWAGAAWELNTLTDVVHKPQWTIGYRFGPECEPENRQNGKALEAVMTQVLRAWLQPLRELHPKQPIVDVFLYELQEDVKEGDRKSQGDQKSEGRKKKNVDMRIAFRCGAAATGISIAVTAFGDSAPDVFIRSEPDDPKRLGFILTHEIGHAFGLADTYSVDFEGGRSTGGLAGTTGIQPPSVMSSHFWRRQDEKPYLSEDDKNGIIWLYKATHEGLAINDCFFPDYVFEPERKGCRPKYPLIFEIKHRHSKFAVQMLDEDPKIDVNAQNDAGFTALHFAVRLQQTEVVKRLLAHPDIKPFLKDKRGRSALKIAPRGKIHRHGRTAVGTPASTVRQSCPDPDNNVGCPQNCAVTPRCGLDVSPFYRHIGPPR